MFPFPLSFVGGQSVDKHTYARLIKQNMSLAARPVPGVRVGMGNFHSDKRGKCYLSLVLDAPIALNTAPPSL